MPPIAGVRVRVLLEEDPFGGPGTEEETFDRLARSGVEVRWSDPAFRFSHVKTFVHRRARGDHHEPEPDHLGLFQNREFFRDHDPASAVNQAAAIFEAIGTERALRSTVRWWSAQQTAGMSLLDLIEGATETLDLYAEVVRDGEMVAALIDAEDRESMSADRLPG